MKQDSIAYVYNAVIYAKHIAKYLLIISEWSVDSEAIYVSIFGQVCVVLIRDILFSGIRFVSRHYIQSGSLMMS
ncbi:hypothetical protein Vspart_01468 [Vibrio spartinae]|uniref:Uncharacterized protein n=1 Tax=Vibrio spartinae TaxID=1918945 RepID=A0A1N6M6H5_9VIBR|nr:hypothetical protein Vspart_01468 [Vibrio spartinae]SIO95024.1 hypothetical protein VSP9026_02763 [Vibrio spartinae]